MSTKKCLFGDKREPKMLGRRTKSSFKKWTILSSSDYVFNLEFTNLLYLPILTIKIHKSKFKHPPPTMYLDDLRDMLVTCKEEFPKKITANFFFRSLTYNWHKS